MQLVQKRPSDCRRKRIQRPSQSPSYRIVSPVCPEKQCAQNRVLSEVRGLANEVIEEIHRVRARVRLEQQKNLLQSASRVLGGKHISREVIHRAKHHTDWQPVLDDSS